VTGARQLEGKVALITGGGSGIGAATARLFAAQGARPVIADIDAPAGRAVAASVPQGEFLALDVTREPDWEDGLASIAERHGRLDILVNNAGILPALVPLEETSLEEWRRLTAVNLDGVFLGVKHGIRAMKQAGGVIVNVASVIGMVGAPIVGAYGAAKGGVRALTRTAAIECAHFKYPIRVNAICPGYIDTEMLGSLAGGLGGERARRNFAGLTPAGRLGLPEEIAAGILFLASDAGAYMTGSELVMDGGYSAR